MKLNFNSNPSEIFSQTVNYSYNRFINDSCLKTNFVTVMDDRTEENNCTGTKWYSERDFGTKLFGSVRGTKFWYETQYNITVSKSVSQITEPRTNYESSVRENFGP